MGLSFAQHLRYGGSQSVSVGTSPEQGPSIDGARAVRITAAPGNGGNIYYKGGALASTLDDTASGDSTATGVGLDAGANSGWLPCAPDDLYLDADAASQTVIIEWMY